MRLLLQKIDLHVSVLVLFASLMWERLMLFQEPALALSLRDKVRTEVLD